MARLEPNLLRAALEEFRNAVPGSYDPALLTNMIVHAERIAEDVNSRPAFTEGFLNMIAPMRELLTDDGSKSLQVTDIFLIPTLYSNAFASLKSGRPTILVFMGLLDSIQFRVASLKYFERLPASLNDIHPFPNLPGTSARMGLSLMLDTLHLLLSKNGCPAPPLTDVLSEEDRKRVRLQQFQGLCFLILHELAHFDLGHLSLATREVRPAIGALLVEEELNDFQREELEADAHVLTLLKPELVSLAFPMANHFFCSLSHLERFLVPAATSHPLTINRIGRIKELVANRTGEMDEDNDQSDYLAAFRRNEALRTEVEHRFGDRYYHSDIPFEVLHETLTSLNTLLRNTPLDLSGLLNVVRQTWDGSPTSRRVKTHRETLQIDPDALVKSN
jgi:hypothetical protein